MNRAYLPSKNFIRVIVIIISLIIIFFVAKNIISYFKYRKNGGNSTPKSLSIIRDIKSGINDENNNGIPNWEEMLWGLDPAKNGPENKEYILAKRKTLNQNELPTDPSLKYMSQDSKDLSQQFFAIIMSLQQSGSLDQTAIGAIAESIGQKVEANPIPDIYKKEILSTVNDGEQANITYFNAFQILIKKYENNDIGGEITLISQALGTNDPQIMFAMKPIASSYKSFGQDLIKLQVPNSIAPIQLSLANNYEKVGQSIDGLTQILSDPIVGLKALINYKKYTDSLVSDFTKMSEVIQ